MKEKKKEGGMEGGTEQGRKEGRREGGILRQPRDIYRVSIRI
jgi:hypothetical protein